MSAAATLSGRMGLYKNHVHMQYEKLTHSCCQMFVPARRTCIDQSVYAAACFGNGQKCDGCAAARPQRMEFSNLLDEDLMKAVSPASPLVPRQSRSGFI